MFVFLSLSPQIQVLLAFPKLLFNPEEPDKSVNLMRISPLLLLNNHGLPSILRLRLKNLQPFLERCLPSACSISHPTAHHHPSHSTPLNITSSNTLFLGVCAFLNLSLGSQRHQHHRNPLTQAFVFVVDLYTHITTHPRE